MKSQDMTRMYWPAYSPDLNPIEHVWDDLGRRIAARLHHLENTQQLKQMLIEEWVLLPQEMLHQLVLSMRRQCEATIAKSLGSILMAVYVSRGSKESIHHLFAFNIGIRTLKVGRCLRGQPNAIFQQGNAKPHVAHRVLTFLDIQGIRFFSGLHGLSLKTWERLSS
ncbi:transposable element Tcb2 transposase [Trichonephila clavipes]|nr:transposable element Tcb2 transposase [Trichonephila clavipes]